MKERVAPIDLRSPNSLWRSLTERVVIALTNRTEPTQTSVPEIPNW